MKESKYVTIYKEWKEKIESGQIAEGERLPTESRLMESYQVSRDTVRKYLNLLEQNGYIQRGRGRASLVMPKQRYTFPLSEIARAVYKRQIQISSNHLRLSNPEIIAEMAEDEVQK